MPLFIPFASVVKPSALFDEIPYKRHSTFLVLPHFQISQEAQLKESSFQYKCKDPKESNRLHLEGYYISLHCEKERESCHY